MPFTTPVHLQAPTHEGDYWITIEPLNFQSKVFKYRDGKPKNYVVPAGYSTDLASVPRLPFVYWCVGGRGAAAAVVHDWLYSWGMEFRQIGGRGEADDVYLEILMEMDVPGFLAEAMHWGVMTFGEDRFTYG